MRHLTYLVVAVVALGLVAAAQAKPIRDKEKFDASFSIPAGQCQYLPAGVTIDGAGKGKSTTTTETREDGTTTITNETTIRGDATDDEGNRYSFFYANSFKISDTVGNPGVFSGKMIDRFTLEPTGRGKHHNTVSLDNGFEAIFTPDGPVVFQEISSFGDPIDFGTGASICDPL